jgi:molybdopterin-guanine dinucleotide biosynthesis protein A
MFTIAIQAGGESRRMGQDKALMPFLGQALILRVLARVTPIADEVLVTTNHPKRFGFLTVTLVEDAIPGRGALGGLYTALREASHDIVGLVACDMPFVNPKLLSIGRDILLNSDADVVIPSTEWGLEPIHAVYRRDTCLPAVEAALDSEKWRLISWLDQVRTRILTPEEVKRVDPRGLTFRNVNTQEEFDLAEDLAREYDV